MGWVDEAMLDRCERFAPPLVPRWGLPVKDGRRMPSRNRESGNGIFKFIYPLPVSWVVWLLANYFLSFFVFVSPVFSVRNQLSDNWITDFKWPVIRIWFENSYGLKTVNQFETSYLSLLKSNNCWFGGPVIRIEAGIQIVWGRNQFEHGPYSIQFKSFSAGKQLENGLKTVWNQLCMSTHVKTDDLKTVTDLKTVIFRKQLWIRITGHFGGPVIPVNYVWKQLWIENSYADRKQLFVSYWIRITADFGDQLSGSDQIRITT